MCVIIKAMRIWWYTNATTKVMQAEMKENGFFANTKATPTKKYILLITKVMQT
jgi:hypothetical protein